MCLTVRSFPVFCTDEEDKERERAREMEQSETEDAMISIEQ